LTIDAAFQRRTYLHNVHLVEELIQIVGQSAVDGVYLRGDVEALRRLLGANGSEVLKLLEYAQLKYMTNESHADIEGVPMSVQVSRKLLQDRLNPQLLLQFVEDEERLWEKLPDWAGRNKRGTIFDPHFKEKLRRNANVQKSAPSLDQRLNSPPFAAVGLLLSLAGELFGANPLVHLGFALAIAIPVWSMFAAAVPAPASREPAVWPNRYTADINAAA
jgi:hypothetical protein